jgi:hypothetical protein
MHNEPMHHRVLIYGMQSSGASLCALLLGQIPRSIAVIDLWIPYVAPQLELEADIVIKATIGEVDYGKHLESFGPTRRILFVRHPIDIIDSLATKSYRDYGGKIEYKLSEFERMFEHRMTFDTVIYYEELVGGLGDLIARLGELDLELPESASCFFRTPEAIVTAAREQSDWCDRYFRERWGLGNIHASQLGMLRPMHSARTWESARLAERYCPTVLSHYEEIQGHWGRVKYRHPEASEE